MRDSTSLKRRMKGHWLSAFTVLSPALIPAIEQLGSNVPCPVEGGTDGFRLFDDANETGGGVKQSFRVFPEGIDLLMWVNDWSFTKTFDELSAWLEHKPATTGCVSPSPTQGKVTTCSEKDLRAWLNQIWLEAMPITALKAHCARAYFSYRGINQAALEARDIRFHPGLNYRDKTGQLLGKFGAIVSLVRNNQRHPVALHRTFITKGGQKVKLRAGLKCRRMTPSVQKHSVGRHIELFQPFNGVLGVCEGLETALAVYQARQFPVWPGLATTMLQSFVPPKGIHTLLNFVDKDNNKAGENAAEKLRESLVPTGVNVIDLLPPTPILQSDEKGVDWADQLKRDIRGFDLLDRVLMQIEQQHA